MYIVFRADTLDGSVAHPTETNVDVRIALETWKKVVYILTLMLY